MIRQITSLQNPLVKEVLLLQEKPRERKARGLFVIEGSREVRLAVSSGFQLSSLFFCPEILKDHEPGQSLLSDGSFEKFEVSLPVYNRMAYRKDAEGILALAVQRKLDLSSLVLSPNPLILVLESVEKPGNLGAIMRTADAAKADAVIICDPLTDIYNPNAVRSSIGCIFTVPLCVSTGTGTLDWLKKKAVCTRAAALSAVTSYHNCDLRGPTALIMGTESTGLSEFWLKNANSLIKIPMCGKIDSMNVSVAAAILVFEARRQRNFEI
jgi:RNA methyltransferase, TrmH family